MLKSFVAKEHDMCFGVVQFKRVVVSPLGYGRKTRGNIRKKSGKFRKYRKYTKTKVIISITHTLKTRV